MLARQVRLASLCSILFLLLHLPLISSFRSSHYLNLENKGIRFAALFAKRKSQSTNNKKGFDAPQKASDGGNANSNQNREPLIPIPQFDPNRGSFADIDPEDDAQKKKELQQQLLGENRMLQKIFDEKKSRRSMYGDTNVDEESLAMEEAMEQYERVRNRADEQIRLSAQLQQIELERVIQDGKEVWVHPLFQELGITLPNPRGKTAEEFDLLENLRQIQSSFLGLRPTPQFNENFTSSTSTGLPAESSSEDLAFDPVFRANSTAKRFTKFYPYGYYGHLPMLTLQSPLDIFGNVHTLPEQYYKLLPTLDAFRLTQEFWRQHDEREEDLASLWYAEDQRKEKELNQLSPWVRAAIFGLDNDNGTFQDLGDKIASFIEALVYGLLFVIFVSTVLGLSNGLMNFIFRRDFEFFLQNEWWSMSFKEVLPHLPRFEGVDLSPISRSLYSGAPPPPSLPPVPGSGLSPLSPQ